MNDRRTGAYWKGREDARNGIYPDYSQATTEELLAYRDGYRDGLREKREEAK